MLKLDETMLAAFGHILYSDCIPDNNQLVSVGDAFLDNLVKYLADNNREQHNDFRSSSVAGNCD